MPRTDSSRHVATEIRRYVDRKGLKPGDRIGTEQELAAQFGVSRPTLREGLRLLAGNYLIRSTQGRGGGIFVASTPNEGIGRNISDSVAAMLATESVSFCELLEARIVLEVPVAGLAAAAATEKTADALDGFIEQASKAEPGDKVFNAADTAFHETLAKATGNDLLMAFMRWVLDVLQPSLIKHVGARTSKRSIIAQHRAIAAAVRANDVEGAEQAMRRHLDYLVDVLQKYEAAAAS
ncbi:MAG TPA: FCD domain-containing protein [Thermoleophilaceae bacterium]|nr:FCD domain-containing protein [Thermoleophilaceae bacterium]